MSALGSSIFPVRAMEPIRRLSRTLRSPKSWRPWGTYPTPARAMRLGLQPDTVGPVEGHGAGNQRDESEDRLQQRGLAHPIPAEDGDDLTGTHLDVDAVADDDTAIA